MKAFVFFLGVLFLANYAWAQRCPDYVRFIDEGQAFRKQKKYREALNKFNAAKLCDPTQVQNVDKQISDLFSAIEGEKIVAQQQRDIAQQARQEAERQRKIAQEATHEALQKANEAKAQYWASESDKLSPTQGIRLLEEASLYSLYTTPVYERLVKRFSNISKEPFTQNILNGGLPVNSMNLSIDHNTIVTASNDSTIKVWSIEGQLLRTIKNDEIINLVAISNDRNLIIGVSKTKNLLIWDYNTNQIKVIKGKETVRSINFSPDEKFITIIYENGIQRADLYTLDNGSLRKLDHGATVCSSNFSVQGNRIITTSADKTAKLWNLLDYHSDILRHRNIVNWGTFSPDGNYILTASDDSTAKIWEKEGKNSITLQHNNFVNTANFSSDCRKIITASNDSTAKVWDIKGKRLFSIKHEGSVNSVSFSKDNKRILTASNDKTVGIWDDNGKLLTTLRHESPISLARFCFDNSHILTFTEEKNVYLWYADANLFAKMNPDNIVHISSSDNRLVVLHNNNYTQENMLRYGASNSSPVLLDSIFSKTGNYVVVKLDDNTRKLLNKRGDFLTTLYHDYPIRSIVFSPNEEYILTASDDKTAKLWHLNGKLIATFDHDSFVNSANFSPDQTLILTASSDKTAKIWNLQGRLLADLQQSYSVKSASFMDENRLRVDFDNVNAKIYYTAEGVLKWLKENNNKVSPLSQANKKKFEVN